MPALIAAGIEVPKDGQAIQITYTQDECEQIAEFSRKVRGVLAEQSRGWKQRSVFEQQWLIRSFKKYASMTVEEWLQTLDRLEQAALAANTDVRVAAANLAHARALSSAAHSASEPDFSATAGLARARLSGESYLLPDTLFLGGPQSRQRGPGGSLRARAESAWRNSGGFCFGHGHVATAFGRRTSGARGRFTR